MNRAETIKLLDTFDILPRRSLGQNFLVDASKASQIAEFAGEPNSVLEVGPGIGALTEKLLEKHRVTAIEIDKRLWPVLEERFGAHNNFDLIRGDALTVDFRSLYAEAEDIAVCANIPYQITTKLFVKILTELPTCSRIVLMMQKEAAERFLSGPGTQGYGPAPILAAWFGRGRIATYIGPHAFYPKPNVTSAVLVLERERTENDTLLVRYADEVLEFLQKAFANRRKTLSNNLKQFDRQAQRCWLDFALREEVSENLRPEDLTPEQWHALISDYILL